METLAELNPEAKRELINLIDHRIEEKLKNQLPTREDFSELKSIVEELAEAQKELVQAQSRTEKRVEELAQAQKRTEFQIQSLAERTERQIRNLARAVGKLSDNIGFGLEDIARVVLPGYLERHLGIQVKDFSRKFFSVNGGEVEVNLYAVGKKSGKRITVLGECKSRIYRREVSSFSGQAEKIRKQLKGDIQLVMFGYWIHPTASVLAKEKDVHLVASYER